MIIDTTTPKSIVTMSKPPITNSSDANTRADSRMVAPITAGTESRKEYVNAVLFSTFLNNAVAIVSPLLEIPGMIAVPCATPINKESK